MRDIVLDIGAGAGKCLGVQKILSEFPQTCPKSFRATFSAKIFPHTDDEDLFLG